VDIREIWAQTFGTPDAHQVLFQAFGHDGDQAFEMVPISTCNRFELCLFGSWSQDQVLNTLSTCFPAFATTDLKKVMRFFTDTEALHHLFCVSCSLDSLILGETQILGQIKNSFFTSQQEKLSGTQAQQVFDRCFHVAKRVRHETDLHHHSISLGHAALEMAKRIFENILNCKILIVGAGSVAKIVAKHFLSLNHKNLTITNRNPDRIHQLQLATIFHLPWEDLFQNLFKFDIVITATASSQFLITHDHMAHYRKQRGARLTTFIDISVPRNMDPQWADLENLFLFDIDDLEKVVEKNNFLRQQAKSQAIHIIEEEVQFFLQNKANRENSKNIGNFHASIVDTVVYELNKSFPNQDHHVLAKAIAKKIIAQHKLLK